jgi:A/G-specific adenine glycosylase
LAYKEKVMAELPIKKLRPKVTMLHRVVSIITVNKKYLMRKNIEGLMKDLWEFPYFAIENHGLALQREKSLIVRAFGMDVRIFCKLPLVVQHFTRYRAYLYPRIWVAKDEKKMDGYEWITLDDLSHIACSSGHRKILNKIKDFNLSFSRFRNFCGLNMDIFSAH